MTELTYGTPEEAGMDPDRIAMLHERAPEWVDGFRSRSGVLLAARRGKIVFHEAYGPLTDKADSPPLQRNSIFSVASCTKPVTATAIMILVEDGRLGLNRPLQEYIPSLQGEGMEDVEVQHLITHTSGFEADKVEEQFSSRIRDVFKARVAVEEGQHLYIAARLACHTDLSPSWTPGSRMDYCGFNYDLLGEVVRVASGQALDIFANENILGPLGMTDSTFVQDQGKLARWVRRGEGIFSGSVAGDPMGGGEGKWVQTAPWGNNGLNTTAFDLATFAQMFLNKGVYAGRKYLSKPAINEMTRNQIPGIEATFGPRSVEASWGLGWMVQSNNRWRWGNGSLNPVGTFSHGGAGGHYFWIDPINEVIGVYLSVCLDIDEEQAEHHWNADLFQNMVTAAVMD